MADVKPVVSLTSSTVEKMSRHDMLEWVNATVNGKYKKIEELCSGIAYCQMMELLFPHCIGLKRVKMSAKLDHEHLHNLKLFQAAFTRLKMDKSVPIDRLLKARFQDNFEFLQWFKKFFDTYAAGKENLRVQGAPENVPKPVRRPVTSTVATAAAGGATQTQSEKTSKTNTPTQPHTTKTPKSGSSTHSREDRSRSVSPGTLNVLQESKEQLTKQIGAIEHERNYYYNKLLEIESLLKKSIADEVSVEWCQHILNSMHAVDDNGGDMPDVESADL